MRKTGTDLTVKANGIDISYDDLGTGLLPVIFIHAFPLNKSSWNHQLESLQESYRVIAYDIRGFGGSGTSDEKASITVMANDLIRFMESLEIDKAIICGLSMGGYIALNAVTRFPDRFSGLILSDTQCIADSPEAQQKRYDTIKLVQQGGQQKFAEGFVNNAFSAETKKENKTIVDSVLQTIHKTPAEAITNTLDALAHRSETCTMLKNIIKPSLILCGESDIVTPPEKSEFMHNKILGSVYHTIPLAAHFPHLEQPDAFNNHLHQFLDDFVSGI